MSLIEQAARAFCPRYHSLHPVSSGLSGGRVYCLKTAEGDFALKQYPAGYNLSRLHDIHSMQRFASSQLPIIPSLSAVQSSSAIRSAGLIPRNQRGFNRETILTLGDTSFDCSRWLPGKPWQEEKLGNADTNLSGDIDLVIPESWTQPLAAGVQAIAVFHDVASALGVQQAPAPAVAERLKRLQEVEKLLPAAIAAAQRTPSSGEPNVWKLAADRLSVWFQQGLQQSIQMLAAWGDTRVPIQWVLRDVHLEHVLFQHDRVTGLIDFDAARPDSVAVDLARWAGSFIDLGLEKARIWRSVWNSYQAVRPISACEQQLAGAMEDVGWHLRLANWVIWVALEKRVFPENNVTPETRLSSLLRRSGAHIAI